MISEFSLPIYGGKVIYVTDDEEYREQCEEYEVSYEPEEGILGLFNYTHDESLSPIYLLGVFDGKDVTLIHELSHMCLAICEHRGFSAHDGNGEPFCYLLDWLFTKIKS